MQQQFQAVSIRKEEATATDYFVVVVVVLHTLVGHLTFVLVHTDSSEPDLYSEGFAILTLYLRHWVLNMTVPMPIIHITQDFISS